VRAIASKPFTPPLCRAAASHDRLGGTGLATPGRVKRGHAFVAGILGGVLVSAVTALARALGVPIAFELFLGTILGHPPGLATWLAGLAAHLVLAGAIALLYGWAFETLSGRADWRVGLAFGMVQAIVGGVAIWALPAIHPLVGERLPSPGPFLSRLGAAGVLLHFGLHAMYGAVVGALYGPTRRYTVPDSRMRRAA
jgi:hypothetical protein